MAEVQLWRPDPQDFIKFATIEILPNGFLEAADVREGSRCRIASRTEYRNGNGFPQDELRPTIRTGNAGRVRVDARL